ncbi:putative quinol monooxygenase [Metabacillus idriensis]|uniref:putative quinol monooxygenase n=1 Tax=Metabacillus idriensis TaxID=324768 RepID=UPI00174B35D1|nr:putative quinol monooxygenase [Metabacillus idriensis]
MPAITITAMLQANEGKGGELFRSLSKVAKSSREEKGCIQYVLHRSLEDEDVYVLYEAWTDEEALHNHIQSSHYQTYRSEIEPIVKDRSVYKLEKLGS